MGGGVGGINYACNVDGTGLIPGTPIDSGKTSLNIKYTGGSGKATYSSKNIRGIPTKGSEGRGNVTVEKEKED